MHIITDVNEMQQRCLAAREAGRRIAFVPTMGYLHEGHISLLREGRRRGDLLVLSIFVNPTQFGAGEDLDAYPRDLTRDAEMAESAGTDLIFAPEAQSMYPGGYATYVDVEGITDTLCGASRPGHFRGVTTVVAKLFAIVQPHLAFFGQKDFQQLAVIRRMTLDLNLPVEVVGMPIVREADGLAMSSRNVYLSDDERRQGLALSRAIALARQMARDGVEDGGEILAALRALIDGEKDARIDYLQICHQLTLQEQARIDGDSVLLMAVFVGKTRLIDNSFLL
ncbi:MAG: pantoate--beta-alanine ligase [Desulfuromonas sp.]|uniref:pantoate--beta-alanine ligase n=1 Tax=Desulfuromonas sp. TaxID=892 RepID=UPI000CC0EB3A|nr:pantoate--beta-alanine ligase [Desulfuromonas sp.]PLX85194.1 MAG: pantoate--beta-alanine ligase [Desulfuromonas sp.]